MQGVHQPLTLRHPTFFRCACLPVGFDDADIRLVCDFVLPISPLRFFIIVVDFFCFCFAHRFIKNLKFGSFSDIGQRSSMEVLITGVHNAYLLRSFLRMFVFLFAISFSFAGKPFVFSACLHMILKNFFFTTGRAYESRRF